MADQSTDHILERELNDVQQKEKPVGFINEVAVKRGLSLTFQLAARGRDFITTKIENIYNAVTDLEQHKQAHNIRILLKELSIYKTEDQINTPTAEAHIKSSFKKFLGSLGYEFALKNFDALLEEKSGKHAKRSDGTVNWYHEVTPVTIFMAMGLLGTRNGGYNLRDLKKWGGLEAAIITHLRHDSAEDFLGPEAFKKQLEELGQDLGKINKIYTKNYVNKMIFQIENNVDLMTRKRLYNADSSPLMKDGKHVKEPLSEYMLRMVMDPRANPVVFMLKQIDKLMNLITTVGAEKYPPERVVDLANDVENQFGSRRTVIGLAGKKWQEFRHAIATTDHAMAVCLFSLFRRLENVDRVYHSQDWGRVGVDNQLKKAIVFCKSALSEAFNPLHIFIRREMKTADPKTEPQKYAFLQKHMEDVIKPVFKPFQTFFPYFFGIDTSSPIQKIGAKIGLIIE